MLSDISSDIAPPPGVLTDEDAEAIRANLPPVPPEERDFWTAHLNQYDAFRVSAPRQVDLQKKAARIRSLENLAWDFDRATLGNGISPRSLELASDNSEAQKAKEALVTDAFIREQTGKHHDGPLREVMRDAVAVELFGEGKGTRSDNAFWNEARIWAGNRRAERSLLAGPDDNWDDGTEGADAARESNLFSRISAAAMRGEQFTQAYAPWLAYAQGKAGFKAERLATYELQGRDFHARFVASMEKARPVAEKVFAGLQQERQSAGAYGGDKLIDELRSLPAELRPMAYAMVAEMAGKEGEKKGEGGQFWQAFGRGTAGLLVGTARTRESEALDDAEKKLAGMKPGDEFGGRFDDLWSYLRGKSAPGIEQRALGLLAEPLLTNKKVTQGDLDEAKARIATERDRLQVNIELEQVGKALLDPIKGKNWFQKKIAYPFAESMLPQMALFAATRNMSGAAAGGGFVNTAVNLTRGAGAMVPMYGMMADQNAQQLMALNPGMELKEAYQLGRTAAVAQTGLEYAQMLLAFGTGSKLGQALQTARASAFKTFGKSLAVGAVGQNVLEGAQDIMPPIVQALHEDAPGVPWEDFFQGKLKSDGTRDDSGYWTQRADTFWAVLPAVVFGAGGSTMRARATRAQLEAVATGMTDVQLHAAGIPLDQRTAILAHTDAVERLDAFSTALPLADKGTAEEGAARMVKQREAAEGRFSEEMQKAGVTLERGVIDGQPTFRVTSPDGAVTQHVAAADAMAAVTGHLDAEFVKTSKPALDMLAALEARPDSPTAESRTTITARQDSAADALLAAEEADNTALADSMKARMAVEQAKQPDAPIDWQKMAFAGQSDLEVQEGILRAVTRIEAGASALLPLEERAETDVKAWTQSGETTWDNLAGMIREVEAATGDTYLHGHTGGKDAAQDAVATTEAYSALTMAYATARGRSGAVGGVARSERAGAQQRLKEAERQGIAGAVFARLQKAWEFFRGYMVQAARLNKARREDKLGGIESFLQRSVGIEPAVAHARGVQAEAEAIYGPGIIERGSLDSALKSDAQVASELPSESPAPDASPGLNPAESEVPAATKVMSHRVSGGEIVETETEVAPERLERNDEMLQSYASLVTALEGSAALKSFELRQLLEDSGLPAGTQQAIIRKARAAQKGQGGELRDAGLAVVKQFQEVVAGDRARMAEALTAEPVAPQTVDSTSARAEMSDPSFSLQPTKTLDAVSEALGTRMARDPDVRRKMVEQAQGALARLRRDWTSRRWTWAGDTIKPVADKRTARELDKEQAFRQADAFDRALTAEGLTMAEGSRSRDSKDYEAWQRYQESRSLLLSKGFDEEAAGKLAEASSGKWRKDHVAAVRRALATAKAEAGEWRKEVDAEQSEDWNPKAILVRNLRILDAILAAFPPEVRAKVGGWVALARLSTDAGMAKEIQRRIDALDRELETSLKKSYLEEIAALREKAEPKREGGKRPQGKLGFEAHRFFDAVENVAGLTEKEVEGRRAEINAEIVRLEAAGELTPAMAADLFEQEQTLDMFGALDTKNAAHLARALDLLQDVYDNGRNRWRTQEEMRLEEVRKLVADTVVALGGVSRGKIQRQKEKATKALSLLKSGQWSIKSFTETMELLFGRNHVLTLRWSRAVREGFAQRTNEVVALMHRWRDAMHRATGKKGRKARHAVWEMGAKQTISVAVKPFTTRADQIPIETFAKVLAGEVEAKALNLSAADVTTLTAQFEALPPESRKGNLTINRVTPGTTEPVQHTEAEGMFLTMLHAQEQYREALARAGYGDGEIAEIEEQITPAAKELRAFMATEYRNGYEPLARVFRGMFGVDLPQIENYSPGAFYHTGGTEVSADPFGPILPDGGFRAGFLKDRKPHKAAPRAESAFSTFFGHANQAAHWKALGEVSRELRAVFGNPAVKQAIDGKHGAEATSKVSEWMTAIEGNGIHAASSRLSRALFTMQAHVALAWKIGTILKQSTALLGAWYRMPTGAYLRGLGRLMAGKLEVADMWKSDLLQRRIVAGFTPEVRAVMANAWNNEPTWRNAFLERGMEFIGLTDAFFTTGSAAISWDYHYRAALKAGQPEAAARAIAEQEAADMVSRTAQPVEVADRSLMELNLSGIGRAMFMFGSEARQKSSLWLTAWANTFTGKATKDDARVLFIAHMILGPMIQAIVSAWRDVRDDDDDELFDVENWNPLDFLKMAAVGPLSGLPFVRDLVDGYHGETGPLSRLYFGGRAGVQLFDGPGDYEPEKVEWYAKRIAQVLQVGGAFPAVAGNIADQAFRITDNMFDDEVERGVKQLKKEDAARDAERDAATSDEQKDAEKAERAEIKEAKIRDAATRAK